MDDPVNVAPYPLAILLCNEVIRDAATEKVTLIGLFETVNYRTLPTQQRMTL